MRRILATALGTFVGGFALLAVRDAMEVRALTRAVNAEFQRQAQMIGDYVRATEALR